MSGLTLFQAATGSSPRVRSRRWPSAKTSGFDGIISACAEQTHSYATRNQIAGIISACAEQTSMALRTATGGWDHLRVCGADPPTSSLLIFRSGSSPRVRSRRPGLVEQGSEHGIISACAEQTSTESTACGVLRDHLRVCGADVRMPRSLRPHTGSSPRVRSRHERTHRRHL